MSWTRYEIENTTSGAYFGFYSGATPLDAYNAMLRDAGEAAAETIPDDIAVTPDPVAPLDVVEPITETHGLRRLDGITHGPDHVVVVLSSGCFYTRLVTREQGIAAIQWMESADATESGE